MRSKPRGFTGGLCAVCLFFMAVVFWEKKAAISYRIIVDCRGCGMIKKK